MTHRSAPIIIALFCLCAAPSLAQVTVADGATLTNQGAPIVIPSTSSSFNQQGFNLPSSPRQSGQDIIRGAGGISCQSAVGTNGPVFDMGVIGTNDIYSRDSAALYGRITVPLGHKPKRIDCSKLYELEVERLKLEIKMMQAGASAAALFGGDAELMKAEFKATREREAKALREANSEKVVPVSISQARPTPRPSSRHSEDPRSVAPHTPYPIASSDGKDSQFSKVPHIFKRPAMTRIDEKPPLARPHLQPIAFNADAHAQTELEPQSGATDPVDAFGPHRPRFLGFDAPERGRTGQPTPLLNRLRGSFRKSDATTGCETIGRECYVVGRIR